MFLRRSKAVANLTSKDVSPSAENPSPELQQVWVNHIPFLLSPIVASEIERLRKAVETRDDGWLPISTVPNGHEEFEFWVEPKLPGESFVDTSGTPIVSTGLGFRHIGKYRTWGSLSKATHWRRCPSPPKTGEES
jgi:hypothetical protein